MRWINLVQALVFRHGLAEASIGKTSSKPRSIWKSWKLYAGFFCEYKRRLHSPYTIKTSSTAYWVSLTTQGCWIHQLSPLSKAYQYWTFSYFSILCFIYFSNLQDLFHFRWHKILCILPLAMCENISSLYSHQRRYYHLKPIIVLENSIVIHILITKTLKTFSDTC